MKTIIEPKERGSTLAQWRGAQVKIWLFHVTHDRMALALSRRGESESVYIVAVGCSHISGPFSRRSANVSDITEASDPPGGSRCRIVDEQAGFELVCSDVVIALGDSSVPPSPFEDFVGGGARFPGRGKILPELRLTLAHASPLRLAIRSHRSSLQPHAPQQHGGPPSHLGSKRETLGGGHTKSGDRSKVTGRSADHRPQPPAASAAF